MLQSTVGGGGRTFRGGELRLRKESARVKDGEWPRITPPYEADYDGKDESTMLEMELTRSFSVIIIFARS